MNLLLNVRINQAPFNQIKSHCSRLHNSLRDPSATQRDRIKLEQLLWAEVKLLKNFKDQALLTYLIGYYHTILYQLATQPSIDDLFHYHVLVRLGDLNRYLQRDEVAEYYYSNARNLFPLFGHAYNQLGLILAKPDAISNNYYKCCYYYARAARSSDKSLTTVAESNLRIASRSNDADILNQLLNDDVNQQSQGSDDAVDVSSSDDPMDNGPRTYPTSATNWFYLMVVAIAVDNISPIATSFLNFMRDNFSTQKATVVRDNMRWTSIYCDRDSYLLLATLDILLDWMKLSSHGAKLLDLISSDLRKIRTCLQSTLVSLKYESNLQQSSNLFNQSHTVKAGHMDTTNSSQSSTKNGSQSTLQDCSSSNLNTSYSSASSSVTTNLKKPSQALPHDYVLKGFKPLDEVHSEILFYDNNEMIDLIHRKIFSGNSITSDMDEAEDNVRFIESEHLKQVLSRITTKMDAFGGRIKKRSRNIALESILSNMYQ